MATCRPDNPEIIHLKVECKADAGVIWSRKVIVEKGISVLQVKEQLSEVEDMEVEDMCFVVDDVIWSNEYKLVDEKHVELIDMGPERCGCCEKKWNPHEPSYPMSCNEAKKRKASMMALDRHMADMHPEVP